MNRVASRPHLTPSTRARRLRNSGTATKLTLSHALRRSELHESRAVCAHVASLRVLGRHTVAWVSGAIGATHRSGCCRSCRPRSRRRCSFCGGVKKWKEIKVGSGCGAPGLLSYLLHGVVPSFCRVSAFGRRRPRAEPAVDLWGKGCVSRCHGRSGHLHINTHIRPSPRSGRRDCRRGAASAVVPERASDGGLAEPLGTKTPRSTVGWSKHMHIF
jgi:hypothetical protein